jgi:hypothetical protein
VIAKRQVEAFVNAGYLRQEQMELIYAEVRGAMA